jgi:hypothetical protein
MAKIKSIRVGFGVSVARTAGNWLKANAEMEIEFDKPEDQDIKDAIWEDAWSRVVAECGAQIKSLDEAESELTK